MNLLLKNYKTTPIVLYIAKFLQTKFIPKCFIPTVSIYEIQNSFRITTSKELMEREVYSYISLRRYLMSTVFPLLFKAKLIRGGILIIGATRLQVHKRRLPHRHLVTQLQTWIWIPNAEFFSLKFHIFTRTSATFFILKYLTPS